ncbi:hypothetical protein QOT17_007089 [Balamuthia mandrillaris]
MEPRGKDNEGAARTRLETSEAVEEPRSQAPTATPTSATIPEPEAQRRDQPSPSKRRLAAPASPGGTNKKRSRKSLNPNPKRDPLGELVEDLLAGAEETIEPQRSVEVNAVAQLAAPTPPAPLPARLAAPSDPPTPDQVAAGYQYVAQLGRAEGTFSDNMENAVAYLGELHRDSAITRANLGAAVTNAVNNAVTNAVNNAVPIAVNNAVAGAMAPFLTMLRRNSNAIATLNGAPLVELEATGPTGGPAWSYTALRGGPINQAAPLGALPSAHGLRFPRTIGELHAFSVPQLNHLLHFYAIEDPANPGRQFPATGSAPEKMRAIARHLGATWGL